MAYFLWAVITLIVGYIYGLDCPLNGRIWTMFYLFFYLFLLPFLLFAL